MANRIDLQSLLEELLGSKNVYYQPPESVKMQYDAIRYSKKQIAVSHANDGARQLIESLKLAPDTGPRLQGKFFNTIVRGARKGKFFLRSAASGQGKTRRAVGDACFLSYPIRYNLQT